MKKKEMTKNIFEKVLRALYKKQYYDFKKYLNELDTINFLDEDGRSILFYTVFEGNIDFLNFLITDKKANVNLKDKMGWTPLHYSVNDNLVEISNLLVNSGANINAQDNNGSSIIFRAVYASQGKGEIIQLLLNNGADPLINNNIGINAIELARKIDNYNIIQFFPNWS